MATSFINYQIALTAENAEVIDTLNKMLIGDYTGTTTEETATEKPKDKKAADKKKPAAKKKAGMDFDAFKKCAIGSKKDNGEEFTIQVLLDAGIKKGTLPAMCKATDEELYVEIVGNWADGPDAEETDSDEGEWGEDEGGDDSEVPTVDAVKAAAKAYAKSVGKDEAKEIMAEFGASALSKIGECNDKQLIGMFAKLV